MKLSEQWLRSWLNPAVAVADLAHRLNMAGIEAEPEPMLAEVASGVVVARIISAERHPQADRLQVCSVEVGGGRIQQIVCGAANARVGILVPCALPGAKLPGGMIIKDAKLRGVESFGMLCSAKELMLAEKSEGLLELDLTAVVGTPIEDYLALHDHIITLEVTPNRGDCLSVAGIARELGAIYDIPVAAPKINAVIPSTDTTVAVTIESFADCSRYVGRVISGINPGAVTPDWMRERLRRSGIRAIHPIVDITNYVLLELGQPMHAFDLAKLQGDISVRRARAGETITLLNEQSIALRGELLITDARGPLALAGVMGGAESGVGQGSCDIFFESACFLPSAVAGVGRRHKLSSDAVYRFERGVDRNLQLQALERATELALLICGGAAGPITQVEQSEVPVAMVTLRHSRLEQLLGYAVTIQAIEATLMRLGVTLKLVSAGVWACTAPSWRYDLTIEEDYIEEVARILGYENIPTKPYPAQLVPSRSSEQQRSASSVKSSLVARGWQEVVTYSFIDPKVQQALNPEVPSFTLDNPIAATMSVMRNTLWSGLIPIWTYNHQRQNKRVRIFELANVFENCDGIPKETARLSGLAAGPVWSEQWGAPARAIDFFDVKAEVLALLGNTPVEFVQGQHHALHPGRTAELRVDGVKIGVLGELHPRLLAELDLPSAPYLFELDWLVVREQALPKATEVSEFPSSRRDISLVVSEATPAQSIVDAIHQLKLPMLDNVFVFDVYRGQGVAEGAKSVALALIFLGRSRTLTVEEIDAHMRDVLLHLASALNAQPRY